MTLPDIPTGVRCYTVWAAGHVVGFTQRLSLAENLRTWCKENEIEPTTIDLMVFHELPPGVAYRVTSTLDIQDLLQPSRVDYSTKAEDTFHTPLTNNTEELFNVAFEIIQNRVKA